MPKICYVLLCLLGCMKISSQQGVGSGDNGNLRLCVVEGRGSFKRAAQHCAELDNAKAGVECVFGTDRLDCLRRMSKGTVDFGVFNPEDLVAAQWANLQVLVTAELRDRPRAYARSLVAVANRRILSGGSRDLHTILQNTTLCHQGHGGADYRVLSDTLTEYMESLVTVVRSCNADLSLTEDRFRGLAKYFARACIAGPWIPDEARDAELKAKYPNLCAACGSHECRQTDSYWGVSGALTCLADSVGDVVWAQIDDVQGYFGLHGSPASASPDEFKFLCRDGSSQPLLNNTEPCAWLHVPWNVLVAKSKAAEAVSSLVRSLAFGEPLWTLLELRETPHELRPQRAPADHLAGAPGFTEAYSRAGCSQPRFVTVCTTSQLEKNKCEWLSEAAKVYGVVPPLQCALRPTKEACFQAITARECDVTVAGSDWLVRAQRDYSVMPVLHEITPIIDQASTVVAYVKESAKLVSLDDLRGKRAAFPRFDGFGWHSVSQYLGNKESKPCNTVVTEYFGNICAPGIESQRNYSKPTVDRLTRACYKDGDNVLDGELQALRSVIEDKSDVAFLSLGTYNRYSEGKLAHEPWAKKVNLIPLCPERNEKYCFLSWSNLGHVYAAKNVTAMRRQEIINIFEKADQLFGKGARNPMFSLYGPYNYQVDVLFHNNTKNLATSAVLFKHPYDKIPMNFERSLTADSCQLTSAVVVTDFAVGVRPSITLSLVSLVLFCFL